MPCISHVSTAMLEALTHWVGLLRPFAMAGRVETLSSAVQPI